MAKKTKKLPFDPVKPAMYLLAVLGDVEPTLTGPYENETARVLAAINHRHQDTGLRDGLYRVDYDPKKGVTVNSFAGYEIGEYDEEEFGNSDEEE